MKTVYFFRFFNLKENNFYILLSVLDIIWFSLDLVIGYYSFDLFKLHILKSLLFYLNISLLFTSILCLIYFLIIKKFQPIIHRFYAATRFVSYFGYLILFFVVVILLIFTKSSFQDEVHIKIIFVSLFVIALPFCIFNAYWSITLYNIVVNSKELNTDN